MEIIRKSQSTADVVLKIPLIKKDGSNAAGDTGNKTTKIIAPDGTALTGYTEATITEPNSDGVFTVKFPTTAPSKAFTLIDQANAYAVTFDSDATDVEPTIIAVWIVSVYPWEAALETTLTDIKGTGWTTETLKSIKDYVDELEARLTDARANNLDNLNTTISSRLASGSYVVPDNTSISEIKGYVDELETRLTVARAGNLDNLDATVSSRLAGSSYVEPDNTSILAIKTVTDKFLFDASNFVKSVQQGAVDILQTAADKVWSSTTRTLTSFGTLVDDIWSSTTRTLTSFGTLIDDTASAVWSYSSRTLTSFGTLVDDTASAVWSYSARTLTSFETLVSDIWNSVTRTLTQNIPTVAEIDTQLSNSHGAGLWGYVAGTGAYQIIIETWLTGNIAPIAETIISIWNEGQTLQLRNGRTDNNGEITTAIDEGTYKIRLTKAGYNFTVPETITVTQNATFRLYGNQINIGTPNSANTCRIWEYLFKPDDSGAIENVIAKAKIISLPYDYSGKLFAGDIIEGTYNSGTGLIYWDIVWGATVYFEIKEFGVRITKIIPSVADKRLSEI